MSYFRHLLIGTILAFSSSLTADICGKIDAGPAWLHIDVLESGKTIQKLNMAAIKADSTAVVWQGLCLKPSLLYGQDGYSEMFSTALGIGHYTPICKQIAITPSVGVTGTLFRTKIKIPVFPGFSIKLKEHFRSLSPYVALDVTYCFAESWRVIGFFQYSWATTDTKITSMGWSQSHAQGPNYALLLEHDLNDSWSVNIGGAYNTSLTREKHGLRAYGVRLAVAYWF